MLVRAGIPCSAVKTTVPSCAVKLLLKIVHTCHYLRQCRVSMSDSSRITHYGGLCDERLVRLLTEIWHRDTLASLLAVEICDLIHELFSRVGDTGAGSDVCCILMILLTRMLICVNNVPAYIGLDTPVFISCRESWNDCNPPVNFADCVCAVVRTPFTAG